ncbi:MAG: hypothetical protein M3Q28_12920 [Pseudomonadota bacterium]|nr:hypothetical protein [Pseudomonadota bacterium]
MNITIMGSGGIGGCIGGRLAASGANVLFLARGAHLEALQTRGLKLTSALGDLNLASVRALASAHGEPSADFVIFTVKGLPIEHSATTLAVHRSPSLLSIAPCSLPDDALLNI